MKIGLFNDTLHTDKNGVVTVIQTMERELTRESTRFPSLLHYILVGTKISHVSTTSLH